MEQPARFRYIDLLKFASIFMVCLFHFWYGGDVYFENSNFLSYFRRFFLALISTTMPLFLAVHGAMLFNKPLRLKNHYRNLLKLVLQFYIWRTITAFAMILLLKVDLGTLGISGMINLLFLLHQPETVPMYHLWFVPLLCCLYLLFPFIKRIYDTEDRNQNSRLILAVTAGVILVISFLLYDFTLLKNILPQTQQLDSYYLSYGFNPFANRVSILLLYFVLGGFLHKYREKLINIAWYWYVFAIFVSLIFAFAEWYITSAALEYTFDNVSDGFGSLATLVNTVSLYALAFKLEPWLSKQEKLASVLQFVGSNTMSVYYLHWIIGYIVYSHIPFDRNIFSNTLVCLFLIGSSLLISFLLKKVPYVRKLVE